MTTILRTLAMLYCTGAEVCFGGREVHKSLQCHDWVAQSVSISTTLEDFRDNIFHISVAAAATAFTRCMRHHKLPTRSCTSCVDVKPQARCQCQLEPAGTARKART